MLIALSKWDGLIGDAEVNIAAARRFLGDNLAAEERLGSSERV